MQRQIEDILALYEAAIESHGPEVRLSLRKHVAGLISDAIAREIDKGNYVWYHREDAIRKLENPEEYMANVMDNTAKNPFASPEDVDRMLAIAATVASAARKKDADEADARKEA